jgi:hypothetical protein
MTPRSGLLPIPGLMVDDREIRRLRYIQTTIRSEGCGMVLVWMIDGGDAGGSVSALAHFIYFCRFLFFTIFNYI